MLDTPVRSLRELPSARAYVFDTSPRELLEAAGDRLPAFYRRQLDDFRPGLMRAVLDRDDEGNLVRKAGVMAIVLSGGDVRPGDPIAVELPPLPHTPLAPV